MTWLPNTDFPQIKSVWTSQELASRWTSITAKAEALAQGIGTGPHSPEEKIRVRRLLLSGDIKAIKTASDDNPRFHRLAAALWAAEDEFAAKTFRRPLLAAVFGGEQLSRMTTRSLAGVLLRDFSRLEEWEFGLFDYFAKLIVWAISDVRLSQRTSKNLLLTVSNHPEWFLTPDAPESVVNHLRSTGTSLDDFLNEIGASSAANGTYAESIRHALYLRRLQETDPAADDPLHQELRRPELYMAPTATGGYFGHRLLEVLCATQTVPGSAWLDTILHIAGDPRLTNTLKWTTWWSGVPREVRDRVQGWLSSEDLRLFLAAVEDFALTAESDGIQRMFPARKTFLEGLLNLGLVKETRLFMGTQAKTHLRLRLGKNVLSDITPLTDSSDKETSAIYLDCGKFHLVEGTHNFRLWIYHGQPAPALTDRRKRTFSQKVLRTDIPKDFLKGQRLHVPDTTRDLSQSTRHQALPHHNLWQANALEALTRFGVSLPADQLMDEETYWNYRRQRGPSPRSSRRQ